LSVFCPCSAGIVVRWRVSMDSSAMMTEGKIGSGI
jgi:hypothetical protein